MWAMASSGVPTIALPRSIAWSSRSPSVRGTARVEMVQGVVPEYAASARHYFGEEQGNEWVEQIGGMVTEMGRVAIRPEWVGILDFETRFPSALSA